MARIIEVVMTTALIGGLACGGEPASHAVRTGDVPWAGTVPHRMGEIDLTIGAGQAEEPYLFGEARGLEIDSAGRIYVADRLRRDVRVFDGDGHYAFTVAGPGEGPGELGTPWDVTFDPDWHLWVFDGNGMYGFEVFEVGEREATYTRTLTFPDRVLTRGLMFDGSDTIRAEAALSREQQTAGISARGQHLLFDSAGRELGRLLLPPRAPPDSFTTLPHVSIPRPGRRTIELSLPVAFIVYDVLAQAPDGRFARVLTSRYLIELFDKHGRPTGEIRRDLAGPAVAVAERDSVQRDLDGQETYFRSIGGTFTPAPVPTTKPPIWTIWYDRDGRLWVQHSSAHQDSLAWADVYDHLGELLFTAEWPKRARLTLGAIRGNVAIGVTRDELDVQRVVRVRFR